METLKRRGPYRRYDSRLKDLVAQGGGLGLIRELRIPRSTLWTWRRRTSRAVVSHEVLGLEEESLRDQAALLARKCEELAAKLDLQESLRDAMGWRLAQGRFPGAEIKERLLNLAEKAAGKLSLKDCLQAIGLSLSRYKSWRMRWRKCELADQSSCPKLSPTKLTSVEISGMGELVCDKRYSHFPIRALAYHAARLGRLMASPGTWARYIGKHAWRRPRVRVYPARPRIGLRAARPNEYWHLDTAIFRLLDGTKAALQACIDNFERFARELPRHDYADNSLYWQGECAYSQDKYADAIKVFERLIKSYPGGNKAPDALLKIALSYKKLGESSRAREAVQRLLNEYPFSDAAAKAPGVVGQGG